MDLCYKFSRYDIATNRLPKKCWWSHWLICYDCAKRVGIASSYEASNLRTMYDKDYPGCEACGKQDELAEVKVSYEVCQKLRKPPPKKLLTPIVCDEFIVQSGSCATQAFLGACPRTCHHYQPTL